MKMSCEVFKISFWLQIITELRLLWDERGFKSQDIFHIL